MSQNLKATVGNPHPIWDEFWERCDDQTARNIIREMVSAMFPWFGEAVKARLTGKALDRSKNVSMLINENNLRYIYDIFRRYSLPGYIGDDNGEEENDRFRP